MEHLNILLYIHWKKVRRLFGKLRWLVTIYRECFINVYIFSRFCYHCIFVLGCTGCDCYTDGTVGQSNVCDRLTGQCDCKDHTDGYRCERCENGYYNLTRDNLEGCIACNCDPDGSLSEACDIQTGQCSCRKNVIGRTCEQCASGYFARSQEEFREYGCRYSCRCDTTGTIGGDVDSCERIGGQCPCHQLVSGRKCNDCDDLAYGFSDEREKPCLLCDCDARGIENDERCHQVSGQCECKEFAHNRTCSVCQDGYHSLDEANDAGCDECQCYLPNVENEQICEKETGKCICAEDGGTPERTHNTCVSFYICYDSIHQFTQFYHVLLQFTIHQQL